MTAEILNAAGVQCRRGRFLRMPAGTYAVYFDDKTVEAADRVSAEGKLPRIIRHDVTVEVYEPAPDDKTETAIEAELDARGLSWIKQDRYWVDDAQRYQVIYEYSYFEKV